MRAAAFLALTVLLSTDAGKSLYFVLSSLISYLICITFISVHFSRACPIVFLRLVPHSLKIRSPKLHTYSVNFLKHADLLLPHLSEMELIQNPGCALIRAPL